MTPPERRKYLYEVLARQPMNPVPMQAIRNSKEKLNERFGTHVTTMLRISDALRQLEKAGKVRRNMVKGRVISKKHPRGIDIVKVYSITVLDKPIDTKPVQR